MTASYPRGIWAPTTKLDWRNILWAAHMNDLQAEIDAIQRTFGLNPHISARDPGGITRNYGTVEERATAHARGLALPFFRGNAASVNLNPNTWITVAFQPASDPHFLASSDGRSITLSQTGMWVVHARAEYKATGHTLRRRARRKMRILVDDADVGLVDVMQETEKNSFVLHNHVTWQEVWPAGTTLSVQLLTEADVPNHDMLANVVFRAYLVRCVDSVASDGKISKIEPEEGGS